MRIHTSTTYQLTDDPLEYILLEDSVSHYAGPIAKCDRAAQGQAGGAVNSANATASSYGGNAAQERSTLIPTLQEEINNPNGFSPTQTNNMLVAGEQGAGGANAAITGAAGLQAVRTRNSAGTSGVFDQAARRNAQTLSQNALGVQNQSAQLAQRNKQAGIEGLQGLYGTDVSAQLKAMGLVPEDINSEVNAGKSGWLQNTLDTIGTLTGSANVGNKIATGS